MSKDFARSVALLAPVPEEHLHDGAVVCAQQGKVAFGSRAFETFLELDGIRDGAPVDVYIYASHTVRDGPAKATWAATYVGQAKAPGGAHPDGRKYRPPSTFEHESDNKGHWALFCEVANLRRLSEEEAILVRDMQGWKHKTKYDKFFIPEGPLIIERP